MEPLLELLKFVVSVAMLLGGAELFIENAERSGKYLGIGVTSISFIFAGAEPEELFASAIASLKGYPTLAFGNAIGTNITILALCLGLSASLRDMRIRERESLRYAVLALLTTLLAYALHTGGYSRIDGIFLLTAYALVLLFIFRGREVEEEHSESPKVLLLMLLGLFLMSLGGDWMVDSSENLSEFLGISDTAFGATILALATSAEMFPLVILPVLRGIPEIAIGGIMGSVVSNNLATLGIAVLITPLDSLPSINSYFLFLFVSLLLVSLSLRDGKLGRLEGVLLLLIYALFVIHFLYLR
ncbi:MAG: cation:H+ antiporter [Archaeoglobi archaeon]|nr:cation:H+ antiporter [Archaeoglobi archaeon]MDK2781094.1 cation:H+ antiporter [Archaeoglobi archaeon]